MCILFYFISVIIILNYLDLGCISTFCKKLHNRKCNIYKYVTFIYEHKIRSLLKVAFTKSYKKLCIHYLEWVVFSLTFHSC